MQAISRPNSKGKILEAAMALLAEQGYAGTSVKSIAGKAGVSQGLMYNFFASKDELLREIFRQSLQEVQGSLSVDADIMKPYEQIEALLANCLRIFGERRSFWRLYYLIRHQPAVLQAVGEEMQGWQKETFGFLENLFYRAGAEEPLTEAWVLQSAIDGLGQNLAFGHLPEPAEAAFTVLLEKYRHINLWKRRDL